MGKALKISVKTVKISLKRLGLAQKRLFDSELAQFWRRHYAADHQGNMLKQPTQ